MTDLDIAIIGLACRFPGAGDVEAFWCNLREGRESVTFFTDEQLRAAGADLAEAADPQYVRAGQVLDGVELFDAGHFGIPQDEAELLDPQHRHFLECALAALENAGYDPYRYPGEIGMFGGAGMNTYLLANLAHRYRIGSALTRYRLMLANDKDFLTTRVSYKLDLRGPSISVNTACSTSLVAVHQACLSLLAGECSLALAGAVHIRLPQDEGYLHQEGMIFSPDGHCRTFDAAARGTIIGSGVGVVVLKALEAALADGDTIHAVIKGTAVNNDGAAKVGFTAPSVERQAAVIREAQRVAGCGPQTIGYVEAHGTGTPLGDPIEVAALNLAFGPIGAGRIVLGSVKTNVGHLDVAAGMAGLIKTVLMLRHHTLVPSLHFCTPNPDIDFAAGPFRVGTELTEWPAGDGPRRAGVSSFGVGGTNAHAVLEEPPTPAEHPKPRDAELLLVSARSSQALERTTGELARSLRRRPELALSSAAYTLAAGRRAHAHRRAVVCTDTREAALALAAQDPDRLHTGQVTEHPSGFAVLLPHVSGLLGVARLYEEPGGFRDVMDECCDILGVRPAALLADGATDAVGALVVPYALARVCQEWGVVPAAYVGWGRGCLVAGCLAGVFGLADALDLAAGQDSALGCVAPRVPVSLGSTWLTPRQATDPATWLRAQTLTHDRRTIPVLVEEAGLVAVELGLSEGRSATQVLLEAVGLAWTCGAEVDWTHWYEPARRRRVPLPTYPYERRRHWAQAPGPRPIEDPPAVSAASTDLIRQQVEQASEDERARLLQEFLRRHITSLLEPNSDRLLDVDENLYLLGADSLILIDAIATLATVLGRCLPTAIGDPPTIRKLAGQAAAFWQQP
ncbi:type I polyketide synthase [Streptomyces sp. XH2]|uniref:type I polyketide synthase n=1 Tax=Streptomyces sp. XH2 TaxID=3412483 RepID=UPI003C7D4670